VIFSRPTMLDPYLLLCLIFLTVTTM